MLGQPYFMLVPQVVGVRLAGKLAAERHRHRPGAHRHRAAAGRRRGQPLRRVLRPRRRGPERGRPGDRGQHVPGVRGHLRLLPGGRRDRGLSPADRTSGRALRAGGSLLPGAVLFREQDSPDPEYSWVVELDLADVRPSLAGPRRPQERVLLEDMPERFHQNLPTLAQGRAEVTKAKVELGRQARVRPRRRRGDRVHHQLHQHLQPGAHAGRRAAGPECGGPGSDAQAAGCGPAWPRARGPSPAIWPTPGCSSRSRLSASPPSATAAPPASATAGRLPDDLSRAIKDDRLVVAAVLSGNRNFEARIHPLVRANYLASPPLVVAFALAGHGGHRPGERPSGHAGRRTAGLPARPVALGRGGGGPGGQALRPGTVPRGIRGGPRGHRGLAVARSAGRAPSIDGIPDSTYVQEPPFFAGLTAASPRGAGAS